MLVKTKPNPNYDWIAQLGEHLSYKQDVAGSNPALVIIDREDKGVIMTKFKTFLDEYLESRNEDPNFRREYLLQKFYFSMPFPLKQLRLSKNMSIEEFAELLGYDVETIQSIEDNDNSSLYDVLDILDKCGCEIVIREKQ
jgi:DNA-binding helix-turn-helix protein